MHRTRYLLKTAMSTALFLARTEEGAPQSCKILQQIVKEAGLHHSVLRLFDLCSGDELGEKDYYKWLS